MEDIKQILFIDIETVPLVPDYEMLPERLKPEWEKKARLLKNTEEGVSAESLYSERAGIFAEFAKVMCIGFGSLQNNNGVWTMRLKALYNDNEQSLLTEFCEILGRFTAHYPHLRFCGHNIKEFDIPFLCRRMIINGMGLPDCMQLSGKKPWENVHIDTMDLWKFGDYKNFTSLSLLAAVLGIPSPKEDMDGSMVQTVYWQERDLERIGKYCLNDVYTTMQVFLKLKGIRDISPTPVYVTE